MSRRLALTRTASSYPDVPKAPDRAHVHGSLVPSDGGDDPALMERAGASHDDFGRLRLEDLLEHRVHL